MKKILYAISMMALLLSACSEDEKEAMPIEIPTLSSIEQFLEGNNLNPTQRENINSIGKLIELNQHRIVLGERNHKAWISKFDANGKEVCSSDFNPISPWKYSFFNSTSFLYTDNRYLFVRGFCSNSLDLGSENLKEFASIIDVNTCNLLDMFDAPSSNNIFNYHVESSNGRYLIIRSNIEIGNTFYVVGDLGKILYTREWGNNEESFLGSYYNKDIMIFLEDEVVAPVISNDEYFKPYKIVNLKNWELIKEFDKEELKPQGDYFGQENIVYSVDTTYLDGNNIKYVYSEMKRESDPISGVKQDRLLNKYYYNIDIDNYKVTYMGKVD
jgi:hypothetical protein|nr:MAG TPA: Protein involved in gliding motility 9 Secretion System Type.5A [Caudoviricetes sp.]